MVLTCVVIECSVIQSSLLKKEAKVYFYQIPADKDDKEEVDRGHKKRGMELTEYSRLCSQHFISGEGPAPNKRTRDLQ
ncbi:hypothetical protein NL108_016447 [Boleophthalmus pectinirostris]|nr:hypothetical protein NL108_016447 [Boleophthalmus pectinirostris]